MEIDGIILIIDLLAVAGFSSYSFKEIKKDLKYLSRVASIIPVAIFGFSLVLDISNLLENFGPAFLTLIYGIIGGHISGLIGYAITGYIRKLMKLTH